MKKIHGLLVVVALSVMAVSARAESIVVSPKVTYAKGVGDANIRKECKWDTTMPQYLAKESDGRVKVAKKASGSDKQLVLVATAMRAAGGGPFSGPKWITLEGKLTKGGKVLGNFQVRRQTMGGYGLCDTLNALGEEMADDILEWLEKPGKGAKLGDAG